MALYVADGYVAPRYVQSGISVDWGAKVIYVPKFFLTPLGGDDYSLDTDDFRVALKDLEDSEEGMVHPPTHRHNTTVLLGGIAYARIIEIINGYTITFEDGSYTVSLIGSNNNILDATNLNRVAVRSNNSAGLVDNSSAEQIAAAVLAQILASVVPANVVKMNNADVIGTGQVGDDWRGVGVPPQ